MFDRDGAGRPPHRDDQRQFADQRAGPCNDFGTAILDPDRAALDDVACIRFVTGIEQVIAVRIITLLGAACLGIATIGGDKRGADPWISISKARPRS